MLITKADGRDSEVKMLTAQSFQVRPPFSCQRRHSLFNPSQRPPSRVNPEVTASLMASANRAAKALKYGLAICSSRAA